MTLPGLVPLVTRPAPLRGAGMHSLVPDQHDDTHDTSRCTYTYSTDTHQMCVKHKRLNTFLCVFLDRKQKTVVSLLRGVHSDYNYKQIRGSSSHYMTALQQTGYRVLSTFPNADPETRSVHTHTCTV